MKSSDVYLKAAELLITGHSRWDISGFSCLAIEAAQGDLRGRYGEGTMYFGVEFMMSWYCLE